MLNDMGSIKSRSLKWQEEAIMKKLFILIVCAFSLTFTISCENSNDIDDDYEHYVEPPESIMRREFEEKLSADVNALVNDGVNFVLVSASGEQFNVSIRLHEPIDEGLFSSYVLQLVNIVKNYDYDYPISRLNINLDNNGEPLIQVSTSDFITARISDLRPGGKIDNIDLSEVVSSIEDVPTPTGSPFDQYLQENNVNLTAKEVQYDMQNNLGKSFYLNGYAKLSTYFNWGYRDIENTHFCMEIIPSDSGYSDTWYIYCNRNNNKELYNALLDEPDGLFSLGISVSVVAVISKNDYQSGQGNLAMLQYVVWDD